jgi:haloalkane dehalogenase
MRSSTATGPGRRHPALGVPECLTTPGTELVKPFSLGRRAESDGVGYRPLEKRRLLVIGRQLALVDQGEGAIVVFLHGGIIASNLWRRVIPEMSTYARCIAVDLLGTGDSARVEPSGPDTYGVREQATCLDALLRILDIREPITLVVHGWASMVGFDWAARHPAHVRGIAHMESIVGPLAWPNIPEPMRSVLRRARSGDPDYGRQSAVIEHEVVAPLPKGALGAYRSSWGRRPEDRKAYLTGLRQIPISGQPADTHQLVIDYQRWLLATPVPKLLIAGEPGMLMVGPQLHQAARLPNQKAVRVVGTHLLPEDSPDGIAMFLGAWLRQEVLRSP